MASFHLPSPSILITIATFLSVTATRSLAQTAPTPTSPGPPNLTAIFEKAGQYTTLIRILNVTQVGVQLESQLNNSFNGLTIFAPTDNAFNNLKAGTLNSLSNQDQVELILYHVLPRFNTFATFETASNPIQTQGSSSLGSDTLNVTSITNNQMNVTTGIVETQVNNVLYSTFPLAVYPVDKVLLPNSLFGAKPPASAPPPAAPGKTPPKTAAVSAGGPSADGSGSNSGTGLKAMGLGWSVFVGIIGLMSIGSVM